MPVEVVEIDKVVDEAELEVVGLVVLGGMVIVDVVGISVVDDTGKLVDVEEIPVGTHSEES